MSDVDMMAQEDNEVIRKAEYCPSSLESNLNIRRQPLIRRAQMQIYKFLENPSGKKCAVYHAAIFVMVITCLTLGVIPSMESNRELAWSLMITEYDVIGFFWLEYCVRLWSAGVVPRYRGFYGRLRFAARPMCLIDLLVLVASASILLFTYNGNIFFTSAIRGIRLVQILRILHVDRRGETWRLLGSVVCLHRHELVTTLYIGLMFMLLSSYVVYIVEKPPLINGTVYNHTGHEIPIGYDNHFENFGGALWWGIVTATTIGYGDYVPRTMLGKIVGACFIIFAVPFFALPAGVLGSGLALKARQRYRKENVIRRLPTATRYIQSWWRHHSTVHGSNKVGTWNFYADQLRADQLRANQLRKNSAVGMLIMGMTHPRPCANDVIKTSDGARPSRTLPEKYKNSVRAARILICLLWKKEFHRCRKPCDVQDVAEKCSQGFVNLEFAVKDLARKVDRSLVTSNEEGCQESGRQQAPVTLRLESLEMQMELVVARLNEVLERLPAHGSRDEVI